MIQEMDKIQVIGPRAILTDVSAKMYEFGKVHIKEVSYSMLDVEGGSEFSLKDVKLNEKELKDIANLEELFGRLDSIKRKSPQELVSLATKIESQLDEIRNQREDVKKEHGQVMGFGRIVETFVGLMEQTHDLDNLEIVGFSASKQEGVMTLIKDKLKKLTDNEFEIFTADLDKKTMAVMIAAAKEKIEPVRELFSLEGVKELSLPGEYADKPLREVLGVLKEKQGDMPADVEDINQQLITFAKRYYGLFQKIRLQAKDVLAVYGEIPKFAESKFTFVMQGWVPKEDTGVFKEFLKASYGSLFLFKSLIFCAKNKIVLT